MKNFIAVGDRLTIPAPADIASGEGVLLETLFGVAEGAATTGNDVVLKLSGVFDLPNLRSAGERTGRLVERLETMERTNAIQRRMSCCRFRGQQVKLA